MKNTRLVTYLILSVLVTSCGLKGDLGTSGQTETTALLKSTGTTALVQGGRSFSQVEANIKSNLPKLTSQAKGMGIKAASCPNGLDQSCLDALFIALDNTKMIKSLATFAQVSVAGISGGANAISYNGTASQPAVNTGFTLIKSNLNQASGQLSTPWSGAGGELIITNLSAVQAGIGAFAVLTNGSSLAGIAGGFAGAAISGYAEGGFYCYLMISSGTPVGACAVLPVTSGGW